MLNEGTYKVTAIQHSDLAPEMLAAMREWVLDCAVDDNDEQDIEDATDEQIVRFVRRQYVGGVGQFIRDCGDMTPAFLNS
jgi:hypothetical protein